MLEAADALLYALTGRRVVSWQGFRALVDGLFDSSAEKGGSTILQARRAAVSALASLGHAEFDFRARSRRVCIAEPVLAHLPAPGISCAVLCGGRSPSSELELRVAAKRVGAVMLVRDQTSRSYGFAPSRIELRAASRKTLFAAAVELGIECPDTPPAWSLASLSDRLESYLDALEWRAEPELSWTRQDFASSALAFCDRPVDHGGQRVRLSRYEHPVSRQLHHRLWRNGRFAEVDVLWGRYAVLASDGIVVIQFDNRTGTVDVPRKVPLPRVLARALTLCSGMAPERRADPSAPLGSEHRLTFDSYSDVPIEIYHLVASKIGQLSSKVPK